jgi:hypothetical protein
VIGVREERIFSPNAAVFLRGEARPASLGHVDCVPDVAREAKCLRRGVRAHVRPSAPSPRLEDDKVVRELAVPARDESGGAVLLQNPARPSLRAVNGVEAERGSVNSDEGHRGASADEDVALDHDPLRLAAGAFGAGSSLEWRPEEREARAPAGVHGAAAGPLEAIGSDGEVARASFRLDARRAFLIDVTERAPLDHAAVAPHHVDAGAAPRAPPLDRAILDDEVRNSGELDAVLVAFGANVPYLQLAKDNAARRRVEAAAVVDVDAVARGSLHDQALEHDVHGVRQVEASGPAADHGRVRRVGRRDGDGAAVAAAHVVELHSAGVLAGLEKDLRPGLGRPHGFAQCIDARDPHFLRRSLGSEEAQRRNGEEGRGR